MVFRSLFMIFRWKNEHRDEFQKSKIGILRGFLTNRYFYFYHDYIDMTYFLILYVL